MKKVILHHFDKKWMVLKIFLTPCLRINFPIYEKKSQHSPMKIYLVLDIISFNLANLADIPTLPIYILESVTGCQQCDCGQGPAIFNSGYPGGANMGGVRKIFDDF